MKLMRKGFTLIELLIVIAIIGALSATMFISISSATPKAKAVTIANNVRAMINAAAMYYCENSNDAEKMNVTADAMLKEMLPAWEDFKTGTIKYQPVGEEIRDWKVEVIFAEDPDYEAIKKTLANIKGFGKEGLLNSGAFTVYLLSGVLDGATYTHGEQTDNPSPPPENTNDPTPPSDEPGESAPDDDKDP